MPDAHRHGMDEVTCRQFVELVTDYLEGAMPSERAELVEEHLVICDSCKLYLDQIQATVEALPGAAEAEAVPTATEEALLSAFREWRDRD